MRSLQRLRQGNHMTTEQQQIINEVIQIHTDLHGADHMVMYAIVDHALRLLEHKVTRREVICYIQDNT